MSTPASSSTAHALRPRLACQLLLIAALLSGLALLMPVPALAAGIVVNTANEGTAGGDGCSLREAITNANADNQTGSAECIAGSGNDTITFAGDYTITLASTLPDLTSNLTIDGTGRTITISGNNAVRVLTIQAAAVVTLNQISLVNGNSANDAAGISNQGALTINNSTLSGNSAFNSGGGIFNNGGTLTVNTSTFSGNTSRNNNGGGIHNQGALTINDSTFSGNSAYSGGGILIVSGTATVSNSTFSGNSATTGGGINNVGTLALSNSTFSGNSATNAGGGIFNFGTLHLRNSLLANSPSGGDCATSTTIATNLNNLIEDGSCSATLSGDPLLSPLGSYGGATQTFALLPGSPAIDAGAACLAADQRGITRPASCDIGAFESRGFSLGNLSGTPQSTLITTAFAAPLGLRVSSNFGEPVGPGGRVAFTAPISGASITASSPITSTTTATGVVSQTVTANGVTGSYSVTATSRGAASPASFSLTNVSSRAAVHSSSNPSLLGHGVTFTATITGVTTPTGQVGFVIDGGTPISVTLVSGQASFTTSSLAVGNHSVVANYGGDGSHIPSSATLPGGQRVWRPVYLPLIKN